MAINFPNTPTTGDTFTENSVLYTWDGEKWTANKGSADLYVEKTGDTMTGDLTAPVVKAVDHMEGVYSTVGFTITGLTTFDIFDVPVPAWCNKIEIDFQDWYSKATGSGYIQLLNNDAAFTTNPVGSRNHLTWGDAFIGTQTNYRDSQDQAVIYGIDADVGQGGSFVINMADEYEPGGKWRCNYTGSGVYQTPTALTGWAHYGQWLATGTDRPNRLVIASNNQFAFAACVGRVRLYN